MLYLIFRSNLILRLSVSLLHESKDLCRGLRSPVLSYIEGILRVIHRLSRRVCRFNHVVNTPAAASQLVSPPPPSGWRLSALSHRLSAGRSAASSCASDPRAAGSGASCAAGEVRNWRS